MITRNFKNILSGVLQSFGTAFGMVSVRAVNGTKYYFSPQFGKFPNSRVSAFTTDANAAGISFGTGNTAATEDDYKLQSPITSGVNVALTSTVAGCGAPANPYIQYTFTITNTGSSTLTITEVGYKQIVNAADTPERNASSEIVVMLDRTVLDTALEIEAGDAGILVYKLETIPEPPKKIGGVDIVSFEWGSDEQLGAMIDAAQAGIIDLQQDAGWEIGDTRRIWISSFTAGNVTHAAQYIDIVITSFDDYNGCGCVLQFDFRESLATLQQMNSTNTNVGGYGNSEMKTVAIPALVDALPTWLKNRLKTFDVLVSAGNNQSTIETVSGNKLALRSEIEIFGTVTYSFAGEGSQIPYYAIYSKIKTSGYSGSVGNWWLRSPNRSAAGFCVVSNGGASDNSASFSRGLSPFGCI